MIEARGLTKRYGDKTAVDNLSFQVRPGHVTGFLGPNGAGKSTTMRMILGLDHPSSGNALVDGKPYAQHTNPMHEIGALLEAKSVHQGRNAYNHLLCLARADGIPKRRVREVLELVGLQDVAKRRTGGFSLGMSQRLGLAQALLGDPPTLMLDEPVNGLDPEGIRWVRELLESRAAEGRAVIVSSHLMSEMSLMAEHLVIVGRGRLIADTSMTEFINNNVHSNVRVRTPQATELADELARQGAEVNPGENGYLEVNGLGTDSIGDIAAEHRLTIHELFGHSVSLEQAFMDLTRDSVEYHAHTPADAEATE